MADLSWREAIVKVLEEQQEAMHYTDIAQQIVEQGLRSQVGATPASTVVAQLSTSVKDEGEQSPFERVSRGVYRRRAQFGTPSVTLGSDESYDSKAEAGLVNAFGMYWRRDWVTWNSVRLYGQQLRGSEKVDFADQRGVYLLHDRREVVYVGRAVEQGIGVRLKAHTIDRLNGRWDRFSWFGIYPVQDDGSLDEDIQHQIDAKILITTMEALLIEANEPPQNRKRGDGFQGVEFIQAEEPELLKKRARDLLLDQL